MNMHITEVELKDVSTGDRLRAVDADYVALLASSISENGNYLLISGGHRLEAVRSLGVKKITAIIVEASELEAQLREIDENLFRRDLSALDRATFLARCKEVYQELHPETRAGGDRRSKQMLKVEHLEEEGLESVSSPIMPTFSDETAERLGLSRQSIDRAISRYKAIDPDVREKIAATWLADSGAQLDVLVKQSPEAQRRIADLIIEQGTHATVADIFDSLRISRPHRSRVKWRFSSGYGVNVPRGNDVGLPSSFRKIFLKSASGQAGISRMMSNKPPSSISSRRNFPDFVLETRYDAHDLHEITNESFRLAATGSCRGFQPAAYSGQFVLRAHVARDFNISG